jgi:hypothetical protein
MKKLFSLVWIALLVLGLGTGCNQPEPSQPAPSAEPITPQEKLVRKEAKALGERLYDKVADRPEPKTPSEEEFRQQKLAPVYDDIEKFIFRQLQPFKERIASITVVYKNSGILCIVYVKDGNEDEELVNLKRATDSCIGKIIDTLPMVKYLIVRTQHD